MTIAKIRRKGRLLLDIAICIPARNEADELPGLFAALERLERPYSQRVQVCLLLDGCDDRSAELVGDYRARSAHQVRIDEAPVSPANAGRARHRALTMGAAALSGGEGLLLTTDADSRPAATWLTAMADALTRADVVTGLIVRRGLHPNPLQDRIDAYYDALFALRRRLDPVPWEAERTHHHTGGANLGIRAAAYQALGGFAPLASGEDARLVDDAGRLGLRVRRDAACLVTTSDRRHGRCPGGLAEALRECDGADAGAVTVAHPRDAAWQYRHHAIARASFAADRFDTVAHALRFDLDHVIEVARDCPNAEAFAMRIVPAPPGGMRSVALPVAEREVAALSLARAAA